MLSYRSHIKETLKLAVPVIVGNLGYNVIGLADTVMIGRLGSVQLAAATLANSTFFFILVIGFGVTMAISALTSQARGAANQKELNGMLHQGTLVSLWMGLISFALILGAAEMLPYLGQEPEVVALAQSYLRIIGISAVPMLLFLAFKHFIEGFEDVLPGNTIMWMTVVANVGLNWLLIYGNLGFPRLELDGAGWATLGARLVGLVAIVAYVLTRMRYQQYRFLHRFWQHDRGLIRKILRIGLPSGFQYFFEVGAFSGAVILAGWIGEDALAAHQIAIQIAALAFMFYLGISNAASIRVGNALGRGDHVALRRAGFGAMYAGLVIVVISVSAMLLFRADVPGLFIPDPNVQRLAILLLGIAAIFQVFDGIQAILVGALRGMSDVRIPTLITFIAYWIIGLPCAYLFSEVLGYGVEGIWYGLTIGLAFSAISLMLRFDRKARG